LPAHPGAQTLPLPVGVAAGLSENITFHNLQGGLLATRPVAGMTWMASDQAHLAGNLGMGAEALPVVYHSLQNNGRLKKNINNIITEIGPASNFNFLIGAEGNPFLAYTTIDWANNYTNQIFAGNLAELPPPQPRYSWTPTQQAQYGNAIRPLAIHLTNGQANGIWFTYTMVGIGDINFPPYNGLSYLNLSNNQPIEFVPPTATLGGISPDQSLIAYAPGQGGTPGEILNSFTIRNLLTCQETNIALNPGSNLGGGFMVFSPDNQFIAWTEASGPSNMEATFRLRVARTNGSSVFDAPIANLTSFLGGEVPTWITPMGWIANHLLVMEVHIAAVQNPVLVVWAPDPAQLLDPTLGANQSAPIADGNFIGFLYP
jgi:hypothetical protein